ncbi:MAG: tryptophan--tRNA ligase [Alphaproteobacteria bacterium]|jgi:tryptophanyl-tRNA synthetase|nr:tryptophan--tRNA ligase [Alphaproteobacteria bacterium]
MKTLLSGIKPTGLPHLGNYLGMLKPCLDMVKSDDFRSYLFIADYHGLNFIQDKKVMRELTFELALTYLSLGLDPEKTLFYRQSDIPEIFELSLILDCVCPKGFMNRAHAYKAVVEKNRAEGRDEDDGVNMGLFNYPVLMAADILMFNADLVPVGRDQVQHLEYTRDLAIKFNHIFGKTFKIPEPYVKEEVAVLPGLDGRKMSKSYGNTIPLFETDKKLRQIINSIKTDCKGVNEPKEAETSLIYMIYRELATADETASFKKAFEDGIGYGDAKRILFEKFVEHFGPAREKYEALKQTPDVVYDILNEGGKKVRPIAQEGIAIIRDKIGISVK